MDRAFMSRIGACCIERLFNKAGYKLGDPEPTGFNERLAGCTGTRLTDPIPEMTLECCIVKGAQTATGHRMVLQFKFEELLVDCQLAEDTPH